MSGYSQLKHLVNDVISPYLTDDSGNHPFLRAKPVFSLWFGADKTSRKLCKFATPPINLSLLYEPVTETLGECFVDLDCMGDLLKILRDSDLNVTNFNLSEIKQLRDFFVAHPSTNYLIDWVNGANIRVAFKQGEYETTFGDSNFLTLIVPKCTYKKRKHQYRLSVYRESNGSGYLRGKNWFNIDLNPDSVTKVIEAYLAECNAAFVPDILKNNESFSGIVENILSRKKEYNHWLDLTTKDLDVYLRLFGKVDGVYSGGDISANGKLPNSTDEKNTLINPVGNDLKGFHSVLLYDEPSRGDSAVFYKDENADDLDWSKLIEEIV
jgi:hypothetical protein